jgi:ATP-dependent helicase Lhr and Lhr-like helicase
VGQQDGPRVLLLGGRSWQVNHIDWQRRMIVAPQFGQR